ncbi:MAG: hypothetical protein AABZ74_13910 [Cyanobacteriota bacterium]
MKINQKKKKGYTLIFVLLLAALLVSMSSVVSYYTISSSKTVRSDFQNSSQAKNIAEAGLQEAAFWFERNPNIVQPSSEIEPAKWHLGFNPIEGSSLENRGDTDDQSKGIVRDIEIDAKNNLYGHFEVLKYDKTKSDEWNNKKAVMDISDQKRMNYDTGSNTNLEGGQARYWRIVSESWLYKRPADKRAIDSKGVFVVPFDQLEIFGSYKLSQNILKMRYNGPDAAIVMSDCAKFNNFVGGLIIASSTSSDYPVMCSSGSVPAGISISTDIRYFGGGVGVRTGNATSPISTYNVFNISVQEMKGISNNKSNTIEGLKRSPDGRFGTSEILFLDSTTGSNLVFDETHPLKGGGILYVNNANLKLSAGSGALFNGIIYMKGGNLTIESLNSITGTILMEGGTLSIAGTSEKADIGFNKGVMTNIISNLSKYKEDSLSYKALPVK